MRCPAEQHGRNQPDQGVRPTGLRQFFAFPANYKASIAPLIPYGQTALPANAPAGTVVSQFWDTNTVWIPLSNGSVQQTIYFYSDIMNQLNLMFWSAGCRLTLSPAMWDSQSEVCESMDFIERLFGISPDGGSGATEAAIALALAVIVIGATFRQKLIQALRRR